MPLSFHKMHANGDDFVVVDSRNSANPMTATLARRLGDRYRGIGFNQLAVILDCDDASAHLMFWNADGSLLDACGSATRGAADLLMRESNTTSLVLRTSRGLLTCERTSAGTISVNMGEPLFGWADIPLAQEHDTAALPLEGDPATCSMGNPHCTYFVDDLTALDIATLGPAIESNPLFLHRTNVHFVQILNRKHIRLRIWERWGGIPLGSGSCSCGAAVNGIRRGLLDDTIDVECDGGTVTVHWDGTGSVFLTGPVERSFSGMIADSVLANSSVISAAEADRHPPHDS
ncbi:diaminopimelate epimerase [Pseudomonas daroniae]|uniref:Diaminopimelate epimerase n=1 Tax=Phytopseudomonas daroniae TaxID=2487519 RepID=A0A4Q9QHH9_9GAMM|nr:MULTISPECIES: diaminopimelate epimerase [Pseudomonas]TBU73960.1 diaminopimelate epimerase [Pseudomonas daroniae]TBU78044.1 diaminopimelate epimerase [Pseudomonas sp. FRB 228]TBU88703.1 diaminopimelate epimerase [Pseudomonas daroniae]